MQLQHIELSRLVISPANMRAKRKARDIAELIPSIRARGILVPLLVRPSTNPDVFEIVAGRRRYFAAVAVAAADNLQIDAPCAVMEPGDDAAALEASLIENVARLDADEVSQWETFARLIKEKRKVADIAATFGIEEAVVKRILALGNLLPRIRALYRTEQINASTVRLLTMATTAQQRSWLELSDSADRYAPTGHALRDWLFGGAAIPTSHAVFDVSAYTAPIIADLFDERSYFSDSALFWELQSTAIEEKKQTYLEDGWGAVEVLQPGTRFERWEYDKGSRSKEGRVYIDVSATGAVEFHEGFLPRREVRRLEKADASEAPAERPELTAPLRRYLQLHRHSIVRTHLLEHPVVALRAMLAHAICGSGLWAVRCERQRADKPETEESIATSRAQSRFGEHRHAIMATLGLDPDQVSIIDAGHRASFSEVFGLLSALSAEDLLGLAAIVMGESLEAGSDEVETLSHEVNPEPGLWWEADEAFFSLIRDRRVLLAILEDIAGGDVAQANREAPGKVLKAIIRDCLGGANGRTRVDGWVPRWLQFPALEYLNHVPEPAHADDVVSETIVKPEDADPPA